jgi:hypothetical protein
MDRREFVRAMLVAAAAPRTLLGQNAGSAAHNNMPAPAPVPWMRGMEELNALHLDPEQPEAVAKADLRFFTAQQMASLRRLCDVMMPAYQGNPSATEALTPQFLDFFIGESSEDVRAPYQEGLDWLEAGSQRSFKTAFTGISNAQADQLLKPWLRTWMDYHLPTEKRAYFVNAVHADIRLATVNSPAWAENLARQGHEEPNNLYWLPIEPDTLRKDLNGSRLNERAS